MEPTSDELSVPSVELGELKERNIQEKELMRNEELLDGLKKYYNRLSIDYGNQSAQQEPFIAMRKLVDGDANTPGLNFAHVIQEYKDASTGITEDAQDFAIGNYEIFRDMFVLMNDVLNSLEAGMISDATSLNEFITEVLNQPPKQLYYAGEDTMKDYYKLKLEVLNHQREVEGQPVYDLASAKDKLKEMVSSQDVKSFEDYYPRDVLTIAAA